MSPTLTIAGRVRATRAARAERKALRRELASFTTQAELRELAAILDRNPGAAADVIRREIDWTAAA